MISLKTFRLVLFFGCVCALSPTLSKASSQMSHFMEEKAVEVSPAFGQKLWTLYHTLHGKFDEGEDSFEFSVIFDRPVSSSDARRIISTLSPAFLVKGATFEWATEVELKIMDTSGHASSYSMDGKYWLHKEGEVIYLIEKKKKFKVW